MFNLIDKLLERLGIHVHKWSDWQPAQARHTTSMMYKCGVVAQQYRVCSCKAEEVVCGKHQ